MLKDREINGRFEQRGCGRINVIQKYLPNSDPVTLDTFQRAAYSGQFSDVCKI